MRKHLCIRENMLHLVILLLTSGSVTLCSHIYREYYLITVEKSWDEAQSYCRENHADLATIGSHDDMKRLVDMTEASGETREIWIGLRKAEMTSWMWSVGETQSSYGVAEYMNWANSLDSSNHCGGMKGDGKWLRELCGTKLPFVCQEGEGSGKMYVVLEDKSWRQAQEHCRLEGNDLASVRSQAENQALQQMINEKVALLSLVWIGLFRDEWNWSDQSDSSLRDWESSQPNDDGDCGLYRPSSKKWFDRECVKSLPFYCYNAIERRIRMIVRLEIKSDSFLDSSGSAEMEAILNQIQEMYEGVKLQWRVQPDGKIFHKKGEGHH